MCYQLRLQAVYQLEEDCNLAEQMHGGVLIPRKDGVYPKGTIIGHGEDGHWYFWVGHYGSVAAAHEAQAHEMTTGCPFPESVFRDYWRWICGAGRNRGAPLYDTLFNVRRKRLRLLR